MKITRTNPITGEPVTLDLDVTEEQMREWELPRGSRRLVQEIFPNLTPDEREFILTGTLPEQWDAMFPEEDEDD